MSLVKSIDIKHSLISYHQSAEKKRAELNDKISKILKKVKGKVCYLVYMGIAICILLYSTVFYRIHYNMLFDLLLLFDYPVFLIIIFGISVAIHFK